MQQVDRKRRKISLFGHFGQINFGNESTLLALLYNLRLRVPEAELTCICSDTEATRHAYDIKVVPMKGVFFKPTWLQGHALLRLVRKMIVGIPSELYRWISAFKALTGQDMLIVSGTGLLTDAYGLGNWGPYNVFKWSLAAKLSGCKLLFVSVGVGPLYSFWGRALVKTVLSLANFRSYREEAAVKCLTDIKFRATNDKVFPDLAFSLPEATLRRNGIHKQPRRVVGLGLMQYAGRLSVASPQQAIYSAYLDNLAGFVKWLLAHEYDVRLLIGDIFDRPVTEEFKRLLKELSIVTDEGRIIDEPVASVDELLTQLAATDVVVATRFHNVLLALLLNKPAISISFHPKCDSLMTKMDLSQYCLNINHFTVDQLITQFCELERNGNDLRPRIKGKAEEFRRVLDEQYNLIFNRV